MKNNRADCVRIGLFFGSFDPIHLGHIAVAQNAKEEGYLSEVWFMVSPLNPFKQSQSLTPEEHRLEMVRRSVFHLSGLIASDFEFTLDRPSYTADTLVLLMEKHPEFQFCLILGSDNMRDLPQWKNFAWINDHFDFLVYMRRGFPAETEFLRQVSILPGLSIDVSSTQVREELMENGETSNLSPIAARYIREKGLYRP